MSSKSDFSETEWNQLLEGVMLAGTAVTAADPSGLWGMLKEGMANAGALSDVWKGKTDNPLIKDIAEEFKSSEGRGAAQDRLSARFKGAERDEILGRATAALGEVARLIETKAPDDAREFKQFLKSIAERVAEASKEGGFLGFGGERVSAAEQSALDEISRVLRV